MIKLFSSLFLINYIVNKYYFPEYIILYVQTSCNPLSIKILVIINTSSSINYKLYIKNKLYIFYSFNFLGERLLSLSIFKFF